MRKLVVIFLSCLILSNIPAAASAAFWSSSPLLTINGQEFSDDDFKNWWRHWNNKNEMPVPDDLNSYIDFQLMVQQARAMELDNQPSFIKTTDVYLKFRSLMALKYEEVDSRIDISEDEYRKYFEQVYTPIWHLQVLVFDKKDDAENAYKTLLPSNGIEAGRLIFADYQGESSLPFQEVEVSPYIINKNKRNAWLPVIRNMKPGYMAEPFFEEDRGNYILLRLIEISQPEETLYRELEKRIHHEVFKDKISQYTSELNEGLVKKYGLFVDEDLFAEIDKDKEYSDEFLERVLIRVGDTDISAGVFVRNVNQELARRPGAAYEFVKNLVRQDLGRQILIEKESLSRHYEEREPLKATWDFYLQNQLRLALERELVSREKVTDAELLDYYQKNKGKYEFPAKETYVLVVNDKEPVEKAWVDVVHGSNIDEVAKAYELNAETIEQNSGDIEPNLAEVISKLNEGGVSKPFVYGEKYAIVKLLARIPARSHSFEEVKSQLKNELLKEKAKYASDSYLDEVRGRSTILVNDEKWKKLKKELLKS